MCSSASGGVAEVFHGGGEAEAARENPFVALDREVVLSAETLLTVQAAVLAGAAVGNPALIAIDDAGDGGLIEAHFGGCPGLAAAFEFDPAVDEGVAVGGGPGAGGGVGWVRCCCHGILLSE